MASQDDTSRPRAGSLQEAVDELSIRVVDVKRIGQSLGLSVMGSSRAPCGDFITTTPAGTIPPGLRVCDQIISINGKDILNMEHANVCAMLREVKDSVRLEVTYRPRAFEIMRKNEGPRLHVSDNDISLNDTSDETTKRVIDLRRTKGSFGFSLIGSSREVHGEFVVPTVKGTIVSGLRSSDQLISVNGQDIVSLTHAQVVALIRASPDIMRLEVCFASQSYFPSSVSR
jgi:C-terminal processing protease CtpA/Prc